MAGKVGRPFSEKPKHNQYRLRLDDDDYGRLDRLSKDFGMSRSDTLRKLLQIHDKKGK